MANKEKELKKVIVDEIINHIAETLDSTMEETVKERREDREHIETETENEETYYILQISRLFRYSSSCCEDLYVRDTSSDEEEHRWFNFINSDAIMANAYEAVKSEDSKYNTKDLDKVVNEELRKAGCLFTQEKIDKYCPILNVCKVRVDNLH